MAYGSVLCRAERSDFWMHLQIVTTLLNVNSMRNVLHSILQFINMSIMANNIHIYVCTHIIIYVHTLYTHYIHSTKTGSIYRFLEMPTATNIITMTSVSIIISSTATYTYILAQYYYQVLKVSLYTLRHL